MKIAKIETFYVPPRWLFVRVEADEISGRRFIAATTRPAAPDIPDQDPRTS